MLEPAIKVDQNEDLVFIEKLRDGNKKIIGELRKTIVGQEEVIHQVMLALYTGGN
ncbi:hypothetical protein IH922_05175 [candidate division KSB1 bacterium]|nr:hypothetical protein [candidate division KSB1 bacterium]